MEGDDGWSVKELVGHFHGAASFTILAGSFSGGVLEDYAI